MDQSVSSKVHEIFWGDAIGGPVAKAFCGLGDEPARKDGYAVDREVWTEKEGHIGFFSHTKYWDTKSHDREAPHIKALRAAIDLPDNDKPKPPPAAAAS